LLSLRAQNGDKRLLSAINERNLKQHVYKLHAARSSRPNTFAFLLKLFLQLTFEQLAFLVSWFLGLPTACGLGWLTTTFQDTL
jgi:hypothetical protein